MRLTHDKTLLLIALVSSLVLHVIAFAVTGVLQSSQKDATLVRVQNKQDDPMIPEEAPIPDDLTLGIEESNAATVTWIGHKEYEQHLAQLAAIEQAAFTPNDVQATPPPTTIPSVVQPVPANLDLSETDHTPNTTDVAAIHKSLVTPSIKSIIPDTQFLSNTFEKLIAQLIANTPPPRATPKPATLDSATEIAPGQTETTEEGSENSKEQIDISQPDAEQSDKESPATSKEPMPEVLWNSGKPIAAQGLEVKPYSLYRHVVIDSGDTMFAINSSQDASINSNPVVSMCFDRFGKAQNIRIWRKSGYRAFDDGYLVSWLSRWRASGSPLQNLEKDECTEPIMLTLIFINTDTQ